MISDKELIKIGAAHSKGTQFGREFSEPEFLAAARAIYEQGRADQRKMDADLCDRLIAEKGYVVGDDIRQFAWLEHKPSAPNTGDINES